MDLLDRAATAVSEAVTVVVGTVSEPIWNQIWKKIAPKQRIGHSGNSEVPDPIGGPSRTRTLDPLIKRPDWGLTPGPPDALGPQQLELWSDT